MTLTTTAIGPKEIDELEIPYGRNKVVAEHAKYEYPYDPSCHERAWNTWFKPLALAQKDRPRPITYEVTKIVRVKHKGKEYLTYGASIKTKDYRKNRIDFYETFGKYELPLFVVQTDPNTEEIIKGSAQVDGHEPVYDIPFTKERAKELLDMFSEDLEAGPSNLIVIDSSGRKFSCNRDEFVNEDYDKLVDRKTGFAEYLEEKERGSGHKKK